MGSGFAPRRDTRDGQNLTFPLHKPFSFLHCREEQ